MALKDTEQGTLVRLWVHPSILKFGNDDNSVTSIPSSMAYSGESVFLQWLRQNDDMLICSWYALGTGRTWSEILTALWGQTQRWSTPPGKSHVKVHEFTLLGTYP